MTPTFIDTHCHLNMLEDVSIDEVIKQARQMGVEQIINPGTDMDHSRSAVELSEKYPNVHAAVGIHPHDAEQTTKENLAALKEMVQNHKVVGIGETGLDYFKNHCPAETQQNSFKAHVQMATEFGLPIIIHDRDAHEDIFKILKKSGGPEIRGVFHCFTGDAKTADQILDLFQGRFYISFSGIATFQNAQVIQETIRAVPLERILIETDAPYLAPEPYRGKQNEPAYVERVAAKIAELKGIPIERVAEAATQNAETLFKI